MKEYESGEVSRGGFDDTYSVTEITEALRQNLESEFSSIKVSGEIANFKAHSSGHYYFTLRDSINVLKCVMFRRKTYGLDFVPGNGMQAVATGMISHYGGSGQTQLIVDSIVEEGKGKAELEMRLLLRKLMDEGLTDPGRKREIPAYPERIAVITSSTGAVIKDIRDTVARRWPVARIIHLPCDVQGVAAASSIVEAFERLREMEDIDVVIAGRGGGSIEDLWAFNLETVARAVAGCQYPVITGIGHEIDTTVCDHVADMRAATPTAAAELATPSIHDVRERLSGLSESIRTAWKRSSEDRLGLVEYLMRSSVFPALRHAMETSEFMLSDRLVRLGGWWKDMSASQAAQVADSVSRIEKTVSRRLMDSNVRFRDSAGTLAQNGPEARIASYIGILDKADTVMSSLVDTGLRLAAARTEGMTRSLEGLYPLAVLKRGYSYCRKEETGDFISSVDGLAEGDRMKVTFHDGNASCLVEEKRKDE